MLKAATTIARRAFARVALPVARRKAAPFALVSCQRSGTHLFLEIFNSNPHAALLSESFCPFDKRVYWNHYVRSLPERLYPPPFAADAMNLLDGYLARITADIDDDADYYGGPKQSLKALGLDVKYNQLRCVAPLYGDLRSPPLLLDYFRDRCFRLIHLVRKNVVHAALSLILAKWRNVWTNDGRAVIDGRYHVTWEMLESEIRWIVEERAEFLRSVRGLPVLTCTYEDMVADLARASRRGVLPANSKVFSPVADLLGLTDYYSYAGAQRKVINRPYTEILEDRDGLVRALRDSAWAEFADTI
jgi:hypothetical protein